MQDLTFCVWLISRSIISSNFICGITNSKISFFLKAALYPTVCVCISHLLYPFICQQTYRLFPYLGIVNNSTMNMGAQISHQNTYFISFGYIPRKGIAGSYDFSTSNFLRNLHTVFRNSCTILHLCQQTNKFYICFLFSTFSPTLVFFSLSDNNHSNKYEVISHCGLDLLLPHDKLC